MKCNLILHKSGFAAHSAWSKWREQAEKSLRERWQLAGPWEPRTGLVWHTQPCSPCLMEGLLIPSLWIYQQLWGGLTHLPSCGQKLPAEALQPRACQVTQTHNRSSLPCVCPGVWERSPLTSCMSSGTPPRPQNCSHFTPLIQADLAV